MTRKSPSSFITKCFRLQKNASIPSDTITSPLNSIIEAIHTIDQLVRTAEDNCRQQQGDSNYLPKSMDMELIEEMLIKWTHIAHFLVETYQQIQTTSN